MAATYFEVYGRARKLWQARRYEEAEEILRRFWQETGIHSLRGRLLLAYIYRDAGRPVSEVRLLREILAEYADTREQELLADALSLMGAALRFLGQAAEAVSYFRQAAQREAEPLASLTELSNALFTANAIPGDTAALFQSLYAAYRVRLAAYLAASHARPYPPVRYPHRRPRVGILSADLRRHAVGDFVRPLVTENPYFVPYVYSRVQRPDGVTAQLRALAPHWREARDWPLPELAAALRADEIDVLLDLSGHTSETALPVFAFRAAPVQISGIGYMCGTGLYETTGFLSDVYCAEGTHSPYFTELLLRLPHTHFCYAPLHDFPPLASPPAARRGYVTFGCFNNFAKLTDEMLLIWRKLLHCLPTAHLLLKHKIFGEAEGRAYARERFRRLGLPLARLELRDYSADYLTEYAEVDIALDPSPYPGGVTTLEALMMGVPVVTLAGRRHGARFGVSFLENLGLDALVARTPADYVEIAAALAQDSAARAQLRRELRPRLLRSPLCDETGYQRELGHLFARLVAAKEWCP